MTIATQLFAARLVALIAVNSDRDLALRADPNIPMHFYMFEDAPGGGYTQSLPLSDLYECAIEAFNLKRPDKYFLQEASL